MKATIEIQKEFIKAGYDIVSIVCDEGGEFDNNAFNKHFTAARIFRKSPKIHTTTGIVENRNKLLRSILQKYFTSHRTLRWIDVLQKITANINGSVNATTKHTPHDIWNGRASNEQTIRQTPKEYFVGDRLRILKGKELFNKGSLDNFSSKVYTIKAVDGVGYLLNEKLGKFFSWQFIDAVGGDIDVSFRKRNKKGNTVKRILNRFK